MMTGNKATRKPDSSSRVRIAKQRAVVVASCMGAILASLRRDKHNVSEGRPFLQ
jgi:hypothetical protein